MTQAEIEVVIAQFLELVPEYKSYDCPENGEVISQYILGNNLPFDAGTLMATFFLLRRQGTLIQVETAEARAVREQAEAEAAAQAETEALEERKRAAHRMLLDEENNRSPLRHMSHTDMQSMRAEEESQRQQRDDEIRKAVRERQQELQRRSSCPTVYIAHGPMAGRVDWAKTYEARKKAGFTPQGQYVGVDKT